METCKKHATNHVIVKKMASAESRILEDIQKEYSLKTEFFISISRVSKPIYGETRTTHENIL